VSPTSQTADVGPILGVLPRLLPVCFWQLSLLLRRSFASYPECLLAVVVETQYRSHGIRSGDLGGQEIHFSSSVPLPIHRTSVPCRCSLCLQTASPRVNRLPLWWILSTMFTKFTLHTYNRIRLRMLNVSPFSQHLCL
jgi:hypothetical protein